MAVGPFSWRRDRAQRLVGPFADRLSLALLSLACSQEKRRTREPFGGAGALALRSDPGNSGGGGPGLERNSGWNWQGLKNGLPVEFDQFDQAAHPAQLPLIRLSPSRGKSCGMRY